VFWERVLNCFTTRQKEFLMRLCYFAVLLGSFALLPAQQKEIKRVPLEPTSMSSGRDMFKAYCATCHGAGGKGDGPAASALKKSPADLTQLARKHDGRFPDAYVTTKLKSMDEPAHGSKDMPVWGPLLSSVSRDGAEAQLRVANLVQYISAMQAK
jgi:mono/diheme cytochrome c family protein